MSRTPATIWCDFLSAECLMITWKSIFGPSKSKANLLYGLGKYLFVISKGEENEGSCMDVYRDLNVAHTRDDIARPDTNERY